MIDVVGGDIDLICFAVALLVGVTLKHFLFTPKGRYILALDLLFAFLCMAGVWALVEGAVRREEAAFKRMVDGLLPTYAIELERGQHHEVEFEIRSDDPRYKDLMEMLRRWEEVNPVVHDIYTLRKDASGKVVRMVDAPKPGESQKRSVVPEDELPEGFDFKGEAGAESVLPEAKPGAIRLAWYPLRDNDRNLEAMLVAEIENSTWVQTLKRSRKRILVMMSVMALLFGVSTSLFAIQNLYRERQEASRLAQIKSERLLALHLEQTPLAAIEWDLHFMARQWNPSAEKIFGFTAEEAIGKSGYDLIVPASMHHVMQTIWEDLAVRGISRTTLQDGVTKTGKPIVCECFHTPLVDPDGQIIGVASLCQDITERRRLEEELRQSQKLQSIGNIASLIAHDFNNILSVIQGHAELLAGMPELPEGGRESTTEITQAIRKGSQLTRQLLNFSRKQQVNLQRMDVGPLVGRVARSITPVLGPLVELTTSFEEPLPPILGDAAMIEQALVNLLLNARDAMPEGGRLMISIRARTISEEDSFDLERSTKARPGHFISICVADTGTGIPEALSRRIFEPFFTTKPPERGTGLGLAAVDGALKQHRGWVDIESVVGEGTAFTLYFPVAMEGETPPGLPLESRPDF